MRKKIRITESQMKRIIAESVRKVLKEGKVVNNKPYFDSYYGGKIKPGEWATDDDFFDNMRNVSSDGAKAIRDVIVGLGRHNKRVKNRPINNDEEYKERQRYRKELLNMLYYNDLTVNDYYKMSKKEQNKCWDNYYNMAWATNPRRYAEAEMERGL